MINLMIKTVRVRIRFLKHHKNKVHNKVHNLSWTIAQSLDNMKLVNKFKVLIFKQLTDI